MDISHGPVRDGKGSRYAKNLDLSHDSWGRISESRQVWGASGAWANLAYLQPILGLSVYPGKNGWTADFAYLIRYWLHEPCFMQRPESNVG